MIYEDDICMEASTKEELKPKTMQIWKKVKCVHIQWQKKNDDKLLNYIKYQRMEYHSMRH